jgi:hypothetical protein
MAQRHSMSSKDINSLAPSVDKEDVTKDSNRLAPSAANEDHMEDISTAPSEKNDNDSEEQSALSLRSTESCNTTTNQIGKMVP